MRGPARRRPGRPARLGPSAPSRGPVSRSVGATAAALPAALQVARRRQPQSRSTERTGSLLLVFVGGILQRHGRLALEADHRRQPAEGGHGVEQPAHAAGARANGPAAPASTAARPFRWALNQSAACSAAPVAEHLEQQPQGRAPRLAHGRVAAGQGERAQMGHAAKLRALAQQHLAAPDGPVGAIAGAVPGEPQHGPRNPCSAMHAATWAWWCCTRSSGTSQRAAKRSACCVEA